MITYVDTSAFLKLLIAEPGSGRVREIWEASGRLAAVLLISAEAAAAVAAAERAGRVTPAQADSLIAGTRDLLADISVIAVTAPLIERAAELARQQGLRGYDAVHLAGALTVGADVMASADKALCAAAGRLGMYVADPLDGGG